MPTNPPKLDLKAIKALNEAGQLNDTDAIPALVEWATCAKDLIDNAVEYLDQCDCDCDGHWECIACAGKKLLAQLEETE